MKVYLGNGGKPAAGGMYQVYTMLHTFLPLYGVHIVDTIEEADVVHAQICLYDKIPANKPLVVSSHGLLWDDHSWDETAWKTNWMSMRSYIQADVVTAPSEFVAHAIRRHTLVPAKVVRHGIDTSMWVPADQHQGYVLWNKARVDPANDPAEMNALAKLAPTIQFISTFGKKTENVSITGTLSPTEMRDFIRNSAVYLDTPKESGGPCFGVLEAMASGVPVLAWNMGGNAEAVVHKETGYLAKQGDYQDLLRGLNYCLQHREKLGKEARKVAVERYNAAHTVAGYVTAYEEAIAAHRNKKKVSVIIPCYNLGKYLNDCVKSVIAQGRDDIEIIVVDDRSTDASSVVASSLSLLYPEIKIIENTHNTHVADARNFGIWGAKGEYILPLDADDRLAAGALTRMVEELDNSRDIQIVSGKLVLFGENDLRNGRVGDWPDTLGYEKQLSGQNRLPYCAMYRRKVWENLGGYRRRIRSGVEDADFWTRAFSYGYNAKLLSGDPILLYTIRETGLHRRNKNGAAEWLSWFPWAAFSQLTPAGAVGKGPYKMKVHDNPLVSFIVPVGPGHTHHIQGCVDSIVAQTNNSWEAIVINDTGDPWFENGKPTTPFTTGMAFVNFVDGEEIGNVAAARNRGIAQAKGKFLVFLDVDDTAQPNLINACLTAHKAAEGGWIYGDWYSIEQGKTKLNKAPEWNYKHIINQSLAPITGLYERQHILEIGGFDETAPGWEDWDLQLRLLEKGICGTRTGVPLIAYNMQYGKRREANFSKQVNLVQYIKNKYKQLHERGAEKMACSRCGGKKTTVTTAMTVSKIGEKQMDDVVMLIYDGPETQSRHYRSQNYKGVVYKVNNRKPFYVFKNDVEYFLGYRGFSRYEEAQVVMSEQSAPLVSEASTEEPVPPEQDVKAGSLEELNLKPEVVVALRMDYDSIEDVDQATDEELLEVKGIGETRLEAIRQAIEEWKQS